MLESKTYFIENRNQQIAYKKYGLQGDETIVFQHGLASKKEDWDSPDIKGMTYIEFFVNKGYRCISIDCLSHGESSIPACLLYTSPSPRDQRGSRMPSSA